MFEQYKESESIGQESYLQSLIRQNRKALLYVKFIIIMVNASI
jgi:hypothetical protein